MRIPRMTAKQRSTLFYVEKHEHDEYGVIVLTVTAEALIRLGWAKSARRRGFAREGGCCVRLTDEGRKICQMIEGTWKA